jgi:hypothetical protein
VRSLLISLDFISELYFLTSILTVCFIFAKNFFQGKEKLLIISGIFINKFKKGNIYLTFIFAIQIIGFTLAVLFFTYPVRLK